MSLSEPTLMNVVEAVLWSLGAVQIALLVYFIFIQ